MIDFSSPEQVRGAQVMLEELRRRIAAGDTVENLAVWVALALEVFSRRG